MISGKFGDGWDQVREETLAHDRRLGCPNGIYIALMRPRMQNMAFGTEAMPRHGVQELQGHGALNLFVSVAVSAKVIATDGKKLN